MTDVTGHGTLGFRSCEVRILIVSRVRERAINVSSTLVIKCLQLKDKKLRSVTFDTFFQILLPRYNYQNPLINPSKVKFENGKYFNGEILSYFLKKSYAGCFAKVLLN